MECYTTFRQPQGIHIHMLIDENNGFKKGKHPLWAWFQNGYDIHESEWVPLTVSDCPTMPFPVPLKIPQRQFIRIKNFIRQNQDTLLEIATDNDIYANSSAKWHRPLLLEETSGINEMSNLLPSDTGLRRMVWMDDNMYYKLGKHAKRAKVYFSSNPDKSVSVGLDDNATIYGNVPEKEQTAIKDAQHWVYVNRFLLRKVADRELSVERFKELMTIFNNGKPVAKQLPKPMERRCPLNNGYSIIYNPENEKFNIAKDSDLQEPLSPEWFESWQGLKKDNGRWNLRFFSNGMGYIFWFDTENTTLDIYNA